jgi:hypothetical protein
MNKKEAYQDYKLPSLLYQKSINYWLVRAESILLTLRHCHLTYAYNNMDPRA